ncbi:hypothetical protein DFJ67_4367 [Asanoa ferruginea]|uniref:Xaa-Pro dipeptidyl-peptidase C-terminal domain-containing protein n=1 Tax=Asanoa ferruginea TaxID=53367 RepID=A0A3D9ZX61_9ACTN|nr:CocE/NonD family hydrolase [Asanoa ferruginea]REF98350.1 hypothetical protein DFJ67_4367 [Asanoa ferruginea]GIF52790.1 X-Pro dipeptidyl-peptidase [Asanoa ferruginea]
MQVSFDVPVPMSDGTVLRADVQLPAGAGPFPTLLQRVPYDKNAPAIRDGALDTTRAVRRGYAVVTQDCRGRFSSDGEFTPFVNEAADGVDTLRWITAQPWSDGNLGMFGRSYSAFLQWQTAALRPDGLRAIAPMFSGANPARDWFGGDSALEWGFLAFWSLRHLVGDPELADAVLYERDRADLPPPDGARLGQRAVHRTERLADANRDDGDRVGRGSLPSWLAAWLDDERRAAAMAELAAVCRPAADVAVPALVIAGWFDLFLRGTILAAGPGAGPRELIVGPWPHGGANPGVFPEFDFGPAASGAAIGLTDRQLDWFDRWLRSTDDSPRSAATWFHHGRGWMSGSWPPPQDPLRLFLGADGTLSDAAGEPGVTPLDYDEADPTPTLGGTTFLPGLEVAANAGPRDQRSLLGRPDVLSWFGDPLADALDIAGNVRCTIATEAGPGVRWVARLVERGPDGRVMLVADGATSTPARAADQAGNAAAQIALGPIAWRFAKGSQLGLMLSHTSWPKHRRWITDSASDTMRKGTSTVRTGPASWLTLGGDA